jgi:hypothetical protein
MRVAPPECVDKLDRGLLRACALSWVAIAPLILDPSSVAYDVFGLDVSGGYGVQQPAAGFLQLAGTLMPLEAVMLLALASGALTAVETRARVAASVSLTGAGVVGTYAAAATTGLGVDAPAAVWSVLSLGVVSGFSVLRPLLRELRPSELRTLYAADARSLLSGSGSGGSSGGGSSSISRSSTSSRSRNSRNSRTLNSDVSSISGDAGSSPLPTFYRSSALASVVVGAAFALSPVSPLAVYEAELPVTYLARAVFGVYLCCLLAPVQFDLYTSAARRALDEQTPRLLNLACVGAIVLLDACGNSQVRAQEVLVAGVDGLPDTFRFEANTTAAFYTALLVAVVYLVQGLRASHKA